ncbi:MAG: MerR family DNA-binding transcriptional regulator, partial [Deltaproteobacteria bacterium]|nr:MerR family DNA-binding transcriptional regulator [Deltaproteobacteria bacterium]
MLPVGKAAKALGVSITTLRRWEAAGKLTSVRTTFGHRRYDLSKLIAEQYHLSGGERHTIAYASVSSHDQNNDL